MNVNGKPYRTVWRESSDHAGVWIIDQQRLPFHFETIRLASVAEVAAAIRDMRVRGAGCIGATAGWGMALAAREAAGSREELLRLGQSLIEARPTAVNLAWAVRRQLALVDNALPAQWEEMTRSEAHRISDEDVEFCRSIGRHGLAMLEQRRTALNRAPGQPLNILTHCNAGWLAFVDYGSATAPIYAAHDAGIPVHVWVDETRPRNQGARLTAWELTQHGVPHTVIADNAGGHLMQRGQVDLVITGADRVTCAGDVANKIGTYLKAVAAKDCGVPFYVALPSSTFDWSIADGVRDIPIEERSPREVTHGLGVADGDPAEHEFRLFPSGSPAANPAFDVTPARLVTGLITERGICAASEPAIAALYPRES